MIMHENGLLDSYSTAWYNNMFLKMQLRTVASSVLFYFLLRVRLRFMVLVLYFWRWKRYQYFLLSFTDSKYAIDPVFTVTKDMNTYAALTLAR